MASILTTSAWPAISARSVGNAEPVSSSPITDLTCKPLSRSTTSSSSDTSTRKTYDHLHRLAGRLTAGSFDKQPKMWVEFLAQADTPVLAIGAGLRQLRSPAICR